MTNPMIQIDDEVREMTDEELSVYQSFLDDENAKKADQEAKAIAKAALLERLGITSDEAALLIS
jgi:hypothetical protein